MPRRATRTNPKIRKEQILLAAIKLSKRVGYHSITRDSVAEIADVSSPLISVYFPTVASLKAAVIRAAIDNEIVEIIAQGLSLNHPQVRKISKPVKHKVMEFLKIK
jgi:AcrR family transcriptional regulator